MTTNATHSAGTKLNISDGASPESFHQVKQVREIDPPGGESSQVDVTNLDSTEKEYITGLSDGASLNVKGVWNKTDTNGQVAMRAAWAAKASRNFQVDFPDGVRASFRAAVLSFTLGASVDNAMEFTSKIKISGAITWGEVS